MNFFKKSYDGGPESGVTGYWLIEWKKGFSIVLLHFSPGSREAYHSHAFNAITFWVKGTVREEDIAGTEKIWNPGLKLKFTPKQKFHRVIAGDKGAWALSFRGPWERTWKEFKHGTVTTLGNGRIPQ